MMKYLIVVDMQNDFIDCNLANDMAKIIVTDVARFARNFDGEVIFTKDTHTEDYLNTQEGRYLPVEHCIRGTWGWQFCPDIYLLTKNKRVVEKNTFGSLDLPYELADVTKDDEIHLCGICTDICVISNAMILKAFFPETKMFVHASLCAGVTEQSHKNALEAMRAVQIEIVD